MELDPERRRQIEREVYLEVEAEERYRQKLRAELASPNTPFENNRLLGGTAPLPADQGSTAGYVRKIVLGVLLCVALFVGIPYLAEQDRRGNMPLNSIGRVLDRYEPVTKVIHSGQLHIPARHLNTINLDVEPNVRNVYVRGRYSASGGWGNDVEVLLANSSEFPNFVNGHSGRAYYSSGGKKTTGEIVAGPLPVGSYVLAFSNRHSMLSDKDVTANVTLEYERRID